MAKKLLDLNYTHDELPSLLKRAFDGPFRIYEDIKDECFRFFTTDENARLWAAERDRALAEGTAMKAEIAALEFAGTFIPGTPNFSATITPIHGDGESAITGSTGNYIQFRANIFDRNRQDTRESMDVFITITNPSASRTIYEIHKSDELVTVNIDDYIFLGDNEITITVKGRASSATKTINMLYNVFNLSLDSSFNISQVQEFGKDFSVNYRIQGNGQKVVNVYIDGTLRYQQPFGGGDPDVTFQQPIINTDGSIKPGKHTLQIYAISNGYMSDLLYYEFMVGGLDEYFTTCLVSYRFPSGTTPFTGNVPGFSGEQYVRHVLDWAFYTNDPNVPKDAGSKNPKITWRLYNASGVETHLATRTADIVEAENEKMPDPIEFVPTDYCKEGEPDFRLQAIIDGYDYTMPGAHTKAEHGHDDPKGLIACYSIHVIKNTNGVEEATNGMLLKYAGIGRSNDEPSETRTDLSYNGIKATFHDMPFNNRYGYINNAIAFGGGAYMTIPLNPLDASHDVRGSGATVEVDFETFDVRTDKTPLFKIGDESGTHIIIYPTRAVVKTNIGTMLTQRFRENERHKIAFVLYADDATLGVKKQRFMMMYVDGIRSAAVRYGETDNMIASGAETIVGDATAQAGIKLYYLRMYQSPVEDYGLLNNFIIDSGASIGTLVRRNDIYVSGSSTVLSVDKLKSVLPVWEVTGPFDQILKPSQDKTAFTGKARYTDTAHPDLYMEGDELEFKPAGESTLSDNMAKGIHVKFNKNNNILRNADGKQWEGNRWTPFVGGVPERKIRLNADGLESSHTHNSTIQNLINEVFRKVQINGDFVLRTPAQRYALEQYPKDMQAIYGGDVSQYKFPYTINYAAQWKPVVVMWRPNETSSYELLGVFSMGEEKKSDFTHGRRSIYLKAPLADGTLDPFDFKTGTKGERGFDNEGIVQFEMVRDSDITFLKSAALWDANKAVDMEKVYQDEDDLTDIDNAAEWKLFEDEVLRPVSSLYQRIEVTNDIPTAKGNQSGFHTLLFSGRFNVWSFLAARIIIRRCGLTDTYVRNSQWLRLPKSFTNATEWNWWFAFWDLDMAFGLQQPSGTLVIEPCQDRDALIGDNFVFTGKQYKNKDASWWWDAFDEEIRLGKERINAATTESAIAAAKSENLYWMMLQMEDALATAGFKAKDVVDAITAMAANYGEALYNADGKSKYLDTYEGGAGYLLRLQGSRVSHLSWWVYESFERWDAEFATGTYQGNAVALRLNQNSPDAIVKITAAAHSFYGFGATSNILESGIELNAGESHSLRIGRSLNSNDPLQIFVPQKLQEIDCSDFADSIGGNIELKALYNEDSGVMSIRSLLLGVPESKMLNGVFNNFPDKQWTMPDVGLNTLETLNINGYRYVANDNTIDMSKMTNLTTFHAIGATGLKSLRPAAGAIIEDYRLPNSLISLVLTGNTIKSLTFWKDTPSSGGKYTISECGVPVSLTTLQMTQGMGTDEKAGRLFLDWLTMVSQQTDKTPYRVTFTNVELRNVDINLIMLLAAMKKAVPSSVNVTGYIHCSTEYTTEQMSTLMDAFGDDIFDLSNSIAFDCDSNRVIISASGEGVTTYVQGGKTYIDVLQGSTAQLKAVGFPLVGLGISYVWYVKLNGDNQGGTNRPEVSFKNNVLYTQTGVLKTTECNDATAEYEFTGAKLSGGQIVGSGECIVRIVKRTYPSSARIVYENGSAEVSYDADGTMMITAYGDYNFKAVHNGAYNGTKKEEGGDTWSIDGFAGFTLTPDGEKVKVTLRDMPNDDTYVYLRYKSQWKNNSTVTATAYKMQIVAIINGVLENNSITGNIPLYNAILAAGIQPSSPNSYNSMDLKKVTGTLTFSSLLSSPQSLVSFRSGGYNIVKLLKNVSAIDASGTGVNETVDVGNHPMLQSINLEGTSASIVIGDE